jgi:hypothetical protein
MIGSIIGTTRTKQRGYTAGNRERLAPSSLNPGSYFSGLQKKFCEGVRISQKFCEDPATIIALPRMRRALTFR